LSFSGRIYDIIIVLKESTAITACRFQESQKSKDYCAVSQVALQRARVNILRIRNPRSFVGCGRLHMYKMFSIFSCNVNAFNIEPRVDLWDRYRLLSTFTIITRS